MATARPDVFSKAKFQESLRTTRYPCVRRYGLRIVAWNCHERFHDKIGQIASLSPDIAVIAECADLDIVRKKSRVPVPPPPHAHWFGSRQGRKIHRGLAVLSFTGLRLDICDAYYKYESNTWLVPLHVRGHHSFNLLAVWTKEDPENDACGEIRRVNRALDDYSDLFAVPETLVVGDFNSNSCWDNPNRAVNHADVVARLEKHGLVSAYHAHNGAVHGQEGEEDYTFVSPVGSKWHIDFCFVPKRWLPLQSVEIGRWPLWCWPGTSQPLSDHRPLIIDAAA